jgi:hypothetical protein
MFSVTPEDIKAWAGLLGVSPVLAVLLVLFYREMKRSSEAIVSLIANANRLLEIRIQEANKTPSEGH